MALIKSPVILDHKLTLALSIDLLIVVPFIYLLLIRKTKIPKTTVVPIIMIGFVIGSLFLPKENQTYIKLFQVWVLPIIEISVVTFIIVKFRAAKKKLKAAQEDVPDFYDALRRICSEILPNSVIPLFATEVAVIYYGFINWRKEKLKPNQFSYHKSSGTLAILGAVIFMIGVETFAIHILLAKWNNLAAWILTVISFYTAIQIFGFLKSIIKRPISVNHTTIHLRYGILNESNIELKNVQSIYQTNKELEKDDLTKQLSPLGLLEGPNVIITLTEPNILIGLYGIKKEFKTIALFVDEPKRFINAVKSNCL